MNSVPQVDTSYYRQLLAPIVRGKRWIVAMDVLAAATDLCNDLMDLGAEGVFCVAGMKGMGALPDEQRFEQVVLEVSGRSAMDSIRNAERAMTSELPASVQERLDRFDPAGTAQVIRPLFASDHPVGGRSVYGARPALWRNLEDKTIIDRLWDEVGIMRAPSQVVPVQLDAMTAAAAELDQGLGCVWVGDNKEGFHGCAEYLRWVRDAEQAQAAELFFTEHCDLVRIMPFLEGIPCSIHGAVIAGEFIALRPCEMVVFRIPGADRLQYARAASYWEPPEPDRQAMRTLACKVGAHLHQVYGYRGFFTVDGIMSKDGFVPTELNPRFGAALTILGTALPRLPLYLLHLAIAHGEQLNYEPAALERLVLDSADRHPQGGASVMVNKKIDMNSKAFLYRRGGNIELQPAQSTDEPSTGHDADATLFLGPGATGGYLRIELNPVRTVKGAAVAPQCVDLLAFADEYYQLGIGPLQAAWDVRKGE